MGVVIMRAGHPALPASDEERSQAQRALADWLISDVQSRLCSFRDPIVGYIDVRDVTLTAEEEAAVRAAVRQNETAAT